MGKISRGCISCRKRKVKCDETRPHCNRCTRFGRVCGGYEDVVFKDGLIKRARKAHRSSSEPLSVPSTAGPDLPTIPLLDINTRRRPFRKSSGRRLIVYCAADEPSSNNPQRTSSSTSAVPNQLGFSAFRDDILISFTTESLKFLGRKTAPSSSELDTPEGSLHFESILAVSTSYIASQYRDPALAELGICRYRKCLKGVNQALRHPIQSKSIHIFGAVISLILHEVIVPTSFDSWSHHCLGLEKLFYHCGPETFMSGRGHIYFNDYRMYIVCACLAVNKPCLLDSPEWCTIPWSLDPRSKIPFQSLLDIMVDLPALIQPIYRGLAEAETTKLDPTPLLPDILRTLRTKLESTEWWGVQWRTRNTHKLQEVAVDYRHLPEQCRPTLWNTRYEFNDIWASQVYTTYLAFKSLLVAIILAIKLLQPDLDDTSILTLSQKRRQASIEICRCAEFTLYKTHRSATTVTSGFWFRMAIMDFTGTETPESRWLVRLFGDTTGGTLVQYQKDLSIALATYKNRKWELYPGAGCGV